MVPTLNGVSNFYLSIPKGSIYLVVSFVYIDMCFVDLSFDAKVIEWSTTVFCSQWSLTEKESEIMQQMIAKQSQNGSPM